jgi:uncharacterized protein
MERYNAVDWLAATLVVVGAINWGLVGLLRFDLVAALFGGQSAVLARIVYSLVGFSGLYLIYSLTKVASVARQRALP